MRLANWDANKVAQFCQDVENKRKDSEKLGEGYAGIQLCPSAWIIWRCLV